MPNFPFRPFEKQRQSLMKHTMIPACFSQPNTVSSHNNTSNHQVPQNLITCIYQTHLSNSPTYLTLTWSKTPFSPSPFTPLTLSPSPSLSTHQLSHSSNLAQAPKSIYLTHHHYQRIKLYWDCTRAEFTRN